MKKMYLNVLAMSFALGACGPAGNGGTKSEVRCVPINEGASFVVRDGRLTATVAPAPEIIERVIEVVEPAGWTDRVESSVAAEGYPWLDIQARAGAATLVGRATSRRLKEAAYNVAKAAIETDPQGAGFVIVDAISIEGGPAAVGSVLAEMNNKPSLAACQAAFSTTMEGRNIAFRTGSASLLPASTRLLEAITAIAALCADYKIEIGGHSDPVGEAALNLQISQQRAETVRNFMIDRGVQADRLTAIGYGETRLLDEGGTAAANARNRRTEFTVSAR